MIQPIMRDPLFLARPSEAATAADLPVARDLLDTLRAHRDGCVGMAANMIGVSRRIIAFDDEGRYVVMLNPRSPAHLANTRRRRAACRCPERAGRSAIAPSPWNIRTSG